MSHLPKWIGKLSTLRGLTAIPTTQRTSHRLDLQKLSPHTDWRNHETHWKYHLHYRRRIGYWPRAGRGTAQTRKQSDHLGQTQESFGLRGECQSGHRGDRTRHHGPGEYPNSG